MGTIFLPDAVVAESFDVGAGVSDAVDDSRDDVVKGSIGWMTIFVGLRLIFCVVDTAGDESSALAGGAVGCGSCELEGGVVAAGLIARGASSRTFRSGGDPEAEGAGGEGCGGTGAGGGGGGGIGSALGSGSGDSAGKFSKTVATGCQSFIPACLAGSEGETNPSLRYCRTCFSEKGPISTPASKMWISVMDETSGLLNSNTVTFGRVSRGRRPAKSNGPEVSHGE